MIENILIAPSINSRCMCCQVQTFGPAMSLQLLSKLPQKKLPDECLKPLAAT